MAKRKSAKINTVNSTKDFDIDEKGYYSGTYSSILERFNTNNANPTFSYDRAMSSYKGWTSAACDINSTQIASYFPKVYAVQKSNSKCIVNNKSISNRKIKSFVDSEDKPSNVVRKFFNSNSDFVELLEHPVIDLLQEVNSYSNSYELFYLIACNLEIFGNAFLYLIKNNLGIPAELQILQTDKIELDINNNGILEGYYYQRYTDEEVYIDKDDMIHFRYPNPQSFYWGMGKIEKSWNIINLDSSYENYKSNLLQNNARPDYLLTSKNSNISPEQMRRLESSIYSKIRGNSGAFLPVPGEIDLKPLSFKPLDMGNDDKIIATKISSIFGVPLSRLIGNDNVKANSEEQYLHWYRGTIYPILRLIEETLNEFLCSYFEDKIVLAFDNPVPQDKAFNLTKTKELYSSGIITLNEARQEQGLDTIDDGDIVKNNNSNNAIDDNFVELIDKISERLNKLEDTINGKNISTIEQKLINLEQKKEDDKFDKLITIFEQSYKTINSKFDELTKEIDSIKPKELNRLEKIFARYIDLTTEKYLDVDNNLVKNFDDKIFIELQKQREEVIKYVETLEKKDYKDDIEGIIESFNNDFATMAQADIVEFMEMGISAGITDVKPYIDEDVFNVTNSEVEKFAKNKSIQLSGQIEETTKKIVTNIIGDGLANGDSIQTITKKITDSTAFNRVRSERIARTETADAYVKGEKLVWQRSGIVNKTQWVISANNVCPICEQLSGKIYNIDDDSEQPPQHVCCRCDLLPIIENN